MSEDPTPNALRTDARRNRDRILEVARAVLAAEGTDASLRDVARRAGVGMGTLYRHFPTRDALLGALLGDGFARLAVSAQHLQDTEPPGAALTQWLTQLCDGTGLYRGLPASLLATLADEDSPLHATCLAMRAAGATLLARAQATGEFRADVEADEVFALVSAVASISTMAPTLADRRAHLLAVVVDGLRA